MGQAGPARRVLGAVDSTHRLALIGNCHAGQEQPQFPEVTPEKKVVRTIQDFVHFGNSMPGQMVLEPK